MAVREDDAFQVLHYVPGQLFVSLRRGPGQVAVEEAHAILRDTLNGYLDGTGVELRSGNLSIDAERPTPVVSFTAKRTTTEIHTFRFDDGDFPARISGESRVPEVLSTLTAQLRTMRGKVGAIGTVEAVTPNWLSASAQGWGTGGGPGLPPEPVPAGSPLPQTSFAFDDQQVGEVLGRGGEEQPVVVAVLDTSPRRCDAADAADRYAALGNTFLKEVVEHTTFHERPLPSGTLAEFAHLVPFWANRTDKWQPDSDPANRDTYYNIVDHGLFVAGVIRSIAPGAEIHLFRVLDDVGVGDLGALLTALNELGELFLKRTPCPRLIVNLSLLIEEFTGRHPFGRRALRSLYFPLFAAIESLHSRDVLIVAAAGNDSLDLATGQALAVRQGPRLPARLNQVLSVAAVDEQGQPATFSNRSDSDAIPNGIAVFGGNATVDQTTHEPEIEDPDSPIDLPPIGIVGVYSRADLPCDKGPNETGLVYWAGTSFAAPVISGLAARRWLQASAPGLPDALIAELSTCAAPTVADLGCGVIKAQQ